MKRKSLKPYLLLALTLLVLVSISGIYVQSIRSTFTALFSSIWSKSNAHNTSVDKIEKERLIVENQLLRLELKKLQSQFAAFPKEEAQAVIPAQIIYRSPASWDSSLWVNVGSEYNKKQGKNVIAHNSPVLVGTSIVGVIDYVGKNQSRIRLITDSKLTPSVRVIRKVNGKVLLLAKGELYGLNQPLWRRSANQLKGIGFNFDFEDASGSARDLRSGIPVSKDESSSPVPLLKEGDLLITTGMDGVFPAGLQAARVQKVHPLKEGDYYYEIDAKPTAGNLDELSLVFILPPTGFDLAEGNSSP